MLRRAIAAGAGLLVLVLLVLGVKGCLNARHGPSAEGLRQECRRHRPAEHQTSTSLFKQLENAGSLSVTEYTNNIASYRSELDSLLQRPIGSRSRDMSSAQKAFQLTMQLRRNALTNIANSISTALGSEGRTQAINKITFQMKAMLASDVLYRQIAKPDMETARATTASTTCRSPRASSCPTTAAGLDQGRVVAGPVSGSASATPGIHGLGLIQTSANGQVLQDGGSRP